MMWCIWTDSYQRSSGWIWAFLTLAPNSVVVIPTMGFEFGIKPIKIVARIRGMIQGVILFGMIKGRVERNFG